MKLLGSRWNSVTPRIIAITIAFLGVVAAVAIYAFIAADRRFASEQMDRNVHSILRAASTGCIEPLLIENLAALDTITESLASDQKIILFAKIERQDGATVSAFPHDTYLESTSEDYRLYDYWIEVSDGPDGPVEIIGRIIVGVSTSQMREFFADRERMIWRYGIGTTMGLIGIMVLTLKRLIGRPVRFLKEHAKGLSGGDMSTPVVFESTDEFGHLAATIEQMRKRLAASSKAMSEQNEELKRANSTKDEFLANMSHEIRTPMTAILGYTDLLREEVTDTHQKDAIETIQRNGEHLLRLINEILDHSKIQSGKLEICKALCSPHHIVEDIASLMRVQALTKGLEFHLHYRGAIPVQIETDATRVRQILLNLLGNAIKFTKEGSVRLEIEYMTTQEHEPHLRFDVMDTGMGISPEQTAFLFEPFTQADASVTRDFGGTGLGLCISKKLAEMLGGGIQVESELGRGSTFSVTIAVGSLGQTELSTSGIDLLENDPVDVKEMTGEQCQGSILLAEDGPDNRRLFERVLQKAGHEVMMVENGQLAVEAVQDFTQNGTNIDLVLMDMQMPVMDGYTAVKTLREIGCELPIVALTAHATKGDQQKCINAGCDDYISKPINPKQFLAKISDIISNNRATVESTKELANHPQP